MTTLAFRIVNVFTRGASLTGDPVAYRIRGALIALRRTQAQTVEIDAIGDRGAA